jgi:hypothetical protein
MYASPLSRYERARSVLKGTSVGAEVRRPLTLIQIGQYNWHVIETDAKFNFKSGFFVETYINGRLLRANCKTCERDDIRHESARDMIASVRKGNVKQASAAD